MVHSLKSVSMRENIVRSTWHKLFGLVLSIIFGKLCQCFILFFFFVACSRVYYSIFWLCVLERGISMNGFCLTCVLSSKIKYKREICVWQYDVTTSSLNMKQVTFLWWNPSLLRWMNVFAYWWYKFMICRWNRWQLSLQIMDHCSPNWPVTSYATVERIFHSECCLELNWKYRWTLGPKCLTIG